jgi:hypothetical protein
MALKMLTDQIIETGGGNVGFQDSSPSYKLSVNGNVKGTSLYGPGQNLTGISKGWEYYTHSNTGLSIGGAGPKVAKTLVSSAPAGDYLIWFSLQWSEDQNAQTGPAIVAPNDDEDAARFYVSTAGGTANTWSMQGWSREQNLNSQTVGQAGFQLMSGYAYSEITSAANINLYFDNLDGDTDPGGFGGWFQYMIWRRS